MTFVRRTRRRLVIGIGAEYNRVAPTRRLGAFTVQACGYTLTIAYAVLFFYFYKISASQGARVGPLGNILLNYAGPWLVDSTSVPTLNDFTYFWIGGMQALHGKLAALYDPARFVDIQAAIVGPVHQNRPFYGHWPNPPTIFLMFAPLAVLSYISAYLSWESGTLLGYTAVVFLIVRRTPSIAIVLASPFTAWNFFVGQTGFLMASLVGAALLALERKPVLAGIFIGCLTYKPQFGILFPVALIAARQWRAIAAAAVTAAVLASVSIAAFGIGPWEALPQELRAQADDYLVHQNLIRWTSFQTVYGLVRGLHGSAALAWFAQGCATVGVAMIVWLVWRSRVRYPLKAATLSAATLLATPYGRAYDMTVIVIAIAFLARDQIRWGLLRGEQTILFALFGSGLLILVSLGNLPLGAVMTITLLGVILRRVFCDGGEPSLPPELHISSNSAADATSAKFL
jgi:arabinofuranan 3-O-arabinosyltransferase